ncbi:hypothetical protein VNI00_017173 [Paramarasmius palmivorus]|uniref:Terpene synthase n=1 Tax=Paramarasmius palmivorus TaxID=297713 RepID=A0AAW0B7E3_9AGAR
MSHTSTYSLPVTLREWPWPRSLNPFYDTCKMESAAWCASFGAFKGRSQSAFERCDFGKQMRLDGKQQLIMIKALLASLAYPLLNKDGNRIACDLMNFFFVVDEYTDVASAEEARLLANTVMDALRNPDIPRPPGEWVGGEIARTFWKNALVTGTPSFQRRFINAFGDYLDGCVEQALDRSKSHVRDIDTYFAVRRKTIGALPSFAVLEVHMTHLSDEVLSDPVIQKLIRLTMDMIILCNDFCSYNVEQARGDDSHNIIRVMMNLYQIDIQGALDRVASLHDQLSREFLEALPTVPTFEDPAINSEVSIYVEGLGNWVRANDCWCFESHRYFGPKGLEIQKSRIVTLLPRVTPTAPTPLNALGIFGLERLKGIFYHARSIILGGFYPKEPQSQAPAATEMVV